MRLFETERLYARGYAAEDAQALHAMLSDAETVRYEPYDVLDASACAREACRRARDEAFMAICRKEDDSLIGTVYLGREAPDEYELGYVFNRAFWGRGYAGEAARGALGYAFTALGARRVCAGAAAQNPRSWHLLERLGMRRTARRERDVYFKLDENGEPLWLDSLDYVITRDEFISQSAR